MNDEIYIFAVEIVGDGGIVDDAKTRITLSEYVAYKWFYARKKDGWQVHIIRAKVSTTGWTTIAEQ